MERMRYLIILEQIKNKLRGVNRAVGQSESVSIAIARMAPMCASVAATYQQTKPCRSKQLGHQQVFFRGRLRTNRFRASRIE
jgi:hypothetical protein